MAISLKQLPRLASMEINTNWFRSFIALALAFATPVLADNVHQETIQFASGTSGSTIKSHVKGYDSVEYHLGAIAGQKMSIQLVSSNPSLYFNVIAPGASAAMYNGSMDGNDISIKIPSSGNYVIQVYLMRNAARRGEAANYQLNLSVEQPR